jgi:lipoate-protein ligase A
LRETRVTESWRFVDLGAVDAFENNAQMAVLSRSTAEAERPTLQTSVWGRTHLNVGWFDDVDDTLDLDACERLGIQVVRRPFAGGGTAFYDAGCTVMFGVMFPKGMGHDALDEEIERMKPVVLDALDRIGLGDVSFRGSADLRWERDRKLGGISAGDFGRVISIGGFLNIKPPNLDLYLQVVRVPDQKFKDKLVSDMREVVCTGEEVAGRPVTYNEFRDALVAGRARQDLEPDRDRRFGSAHFLDALSRVGTRRDARRVREPQGEETRAGGRRARRRRHRRRGLSRGRHARGTARHARSRRRRAGGRACK